MHQTHSFIIQITPHHQPHSSSSSSSSSYSSMKLFNRFRKILMRILFSFPSSKSKSPSEMGGERFEPPKTSCSSYYSSQSHYSEAINDCIDFFNKSNSQEEQEEPCKC
ncbi:hypothetical protein M5689_016379 [Euphorbia peplus]|nr:hypothetical protein M5689_016379 [Euphorbia peplus]